MAKGDVCWPAAWEWVQTAWPDPHGFWLGGSEYPTGRGLPDKPENGWLCPGCQRGYSPKVYQCSRCGPQAKPADPG